MSSLSSPGTPAGRGQREPGDDAAGDDRVDQRVTGSQAADRGDQLVGRVVQEALTNAFKHAAGAPVDITVHGDGAGVTVDIVNAAPRERPAGLARSGGGYGLAGMRERVGACGGSLTSGPTTAGGWQVSAALPASLSRQPSEPVAGQ